MRTNITCEELYDLYIIKKIPTKEISQMMGYPNGNRIRYLLNKYKIPKNPRGGAYKKDDLTNRRFGKYLVIKQVESDASYNTRWLCKCDCGNESVVDRPGLIRNHALSCGKCTRTYNWRGCGEISGCYFTAIKSGAKRRHLECSISIQDIWELFLKQNKKCALSGMELVFVSDYMTYGKKQTASLDRIDSSRGYTIDNIQWIHKDINFMKQGKSDKYFIEMCHKISEHNKQKIKL